MAKSYDRELFEVLTKTLSALDRIQNALQPLLDQYREQTLTMPQMPKGKSDCVVCAGDGYVQFIDSETDLWTSRLCECISD